MNDERSEDVDRRLESILAEHREPEEEVEEEPAAFEPFAPLPPSPGGADTDEPSEAHADGSAGGGDAGHALPHAPLFALLRNIEAEIGVERIDSIWVFPPRRVEAGETSVVVVSAFPDVDADRRRVYAAHYTAPGLSSEPLLVLDEFGTAPTDRVGRLVEEVVDRLKEGPPGAPRSHPIDGREERWAAVLHDLAESYLAEAQKDPRLRR